MQILSMVSSKVSLLRTVGFQLLLYGDEDVVSERLVLDPFLQLLLPVHLLWLDLSHSAPIAGGRR